MLFLGIEKSWYVAIYHYERQRGTYSYKVQRESVRRRYLWQQYSLFREILATFQQLSVSTGYIVGLLNV